jgi:SOS-response transcriptional repressor LexA
MHRKDTRRTRLEQLCKENGGYVAVAEHAHVSADNLWQIINAVQLPSGNPRGLGDALAAKLEKAFGLSEGWMDLPPDGTENVKAAPRRRRVPLISWVQAGAWNDVIDNFEPGDADDWVDVYDVVPGDNAFALRVSGDSMTSPHAGDALTFPEGTIVVVDPSRAVNPGDFVVAKDMRTQQATFKKLTSDGGRLYLKPLNPAYPLIEIDSKGMHLVGKVIEYSFRRQL